LPLNVQVRSLASYAPRSASAATEHEIQTLQRAWAESKVAEANAELQLAGRLGAFHGFSKFLATGLKVRDAWSAVLQKERIASVVSADENNPFTRLPILLAHRRGIPTIYTEHGALNFNLGLRVPVSDCYLASGEMMKDYWLRHCRLPVEKIELGVPMDAQVGESQTSRGKRDLIVFFSSDYEAAGCRAEGFYREILPPLCSLAQQNDCRVVLKLHPFESIAGRRRLVEKILTGEQRAYLELRGGPLTSELLDRAWIAVTVESSAAVECALAAIPTFLCAWLDASWWEYGKQFACFSVAQPLLSPNEIVDIPQRMQSQEKMLPEKQALAVPMTVDRLEEMIGFTRARTSGSGARKISS
jgi:hypothetical protein